MEKVQEMVLAAQEGDREAFGWLYRETYDRNYYIVIKMVKNEQDAMDVLQDAYVKIFQKLATFRYNGSKSFASWTSKVASNTALDFLRKKNPILFSEMRGEDDGDIPELDFEDESVENQPELALDRKETARIVQELLDCLSEEQRICVILRYVREMKISEIAAECGCSENTVKSRLNYAKKRLLGERETLEKKGIRLYSVAPFTLLAFLLGEEAYACEAPAALSSGFSVVLDRVSGGEDGSFAPPEGAGEQAAGEPVKPAVEGAGKAVAQKAGKAAAGQAGRTAARWGTGKMLAAAAAALVAVGAVSGTLWVRHAQKPQEEAESPPVTTEASPDAEEAAAAEEPEEEPETAEETASEPEPAAEPRTEEEIYYEFISRELVPRYGLAELEAEGHVTAEALDGYLDADSLYAPGNRWLKPMGLIAAHISDLDLDGDKELFVIYWENEVNERGSHDMIGDVYETDGEEVVLQDSLTLSVNEYQWIENYQSEGNFSALEVTSGEKKYLLFYVYDRDVCYTESYNAHTMWTVEYKDGRLRKVREVVPEFLARQLEVNDYDGVVYEDGEEKQRVLLYDGVSPEICDTVEETFIRFFREDGLDVSAFMEGMDTLYPQSFANTENASVIFTFNSKMTSYESEDDGARYTSYMEAVISDETHLRDHITIE